MQTEEPQVVFWGEHADIRVIEFDKSRVCKYFIGALVIKFAKPNMQIDQTFIAFAALQNLVSSRAVLRCHAQVQIEIGSHTGLRIETSGCPPFHQQWFNSISSEKRNNLLKVQLMEPRFKRLKSILRLKQLTYLRVSEIRLSELTPA